MTITEDTQALEAWENEGGAYIVTPEQERSGEEKDTRAPEVLGWRRIISPAADPCADCLALTKPLYEGWREAAEPACKGCTCQAMPVWAEAS